MTPRRRRTGPAAILMALCLVAVACSSGAESVPSEQAEIASPTTAMSTNSSTSTTASPSTSAVTTTEPAPVPEPIPIDPPDPVPVDPPEGMELVWADEFDGDEIDFTSWTYDIGGWGWGNGEAQYYTDRPVNARLDSGLLVIELHQEPYDGSFYTSARLKTQGLREFQYGRIEARILVPKGAGTWLAFWMLGSGFEEDAPDEANRWPLVGEIDIMEYVGRQPDLLMGTLHGPGYAGPGGKSSWNRQEFEIGDDFHTFAIDWDAEGIRWYFDGEMYHEVGPDDLGRREWVFDKPFFIILNLALGGSLGGSLDPDLEFPIRYYVDHVRVYQGLPDAS